MWGTLISKAKYLVWIIGLIILSFNVFGTTLTNGVMAYFSGNEGVNWLNDSLGGLPNLDNSSGMFYTSQGFINGGFNGSDDTYSFYDTRSTSNILCADEVYNRTYSVWAKLLMTNAWSNIIAGSDPGTSNLLLRASSGKLYYFPDGVNQVSSELMINDSLWKHYVLIVNTSHITLYVNGTKRNQTAVGTINNIVGCRFGIGTIPTFSAQSFNGTLDEVAIWNRSLSESEIIELYNSGNGLTFPFNANNNINISSPYPIGDSHFINSTININASMNNTFNTNVSLYINSTLNQTRQYSPGTNNISFNVTLPKGSYSYYLYAESNSSNNLTTTTKIFSIDTNSINITIRSENTNALIYYNVSVRFSSNFSSEIYYYTNTSNLYVENLTEGEYQLLFSNTNYSSRTYIITISNGYSQVLTAYLPSTNLTTLFTILDKDTGGLVEGALCTMYRNIGGSWVAVESKISDITGKAQFTYITEMNYKFYISKADYEDYVFYLNPILFSSYDINLEKSVTQDIYYDYDDVGIIYTTLFNEGLNNFSFIIQSPSGSLINYGYNLTYPHSTNVSSGSNSIGGQLSSVINISNPEFNDVVNLDYYYTSSIYGRRNFTALLTININSTYMNRTMISNQNITYGLGVVERLLIATLLIIFLVGITSLMGNATLGMVLGLLMFGVLAYIGFVPLWAILITMAFGVLMIGLGVK